MDIRSALSLLQEARNLPVPAPIVDKTALLAEVNQTWARLKTLDVVLQPYPKLSAEVANDFKRMKTRHDAERQRYLEQYPDDPDADIGEFDVEDNLGRIADGVVKYAFGYGRTEIARMEEEYYRSFAEHFGYDLDDMGARPEQSVYLSALDQQEKLMTELDGFKPSRFETYERLLEHCNVLVGVFKAFDGREQFAQPELNDDTRSELCEVFPLMILMLKAGSTPTL